MRSLYPRLASYTNNSIALFWALTFISGLWMVRVWWLGLLCAVAASVTALELWRRISKTQVLRGRLGARLGLGGVPFVAGLLLGVLPAWLAYLAALAGLGVLAYFVYLAVRLRGDDAAKLAREAELGQDGLLAAELHILSKNWVLAGEHLERLGEHDWALALFIKGQSWRRAGQAFEVRGRIEEAVSYYCKAGAPEDAARLARQADSRTQLRAAELLSAAGYRSHAAPLFEAAGRLSEAGAAYEASGLLADAGRCYSAAGEVRKAAGLFERAGHYEAAARLYEGLGQLSYAAGLLARARDYLSALRLAVKAGDAQRAASVFGNVDRQGISSLGSDDVRRLAELLGRAGKTVESAGLYAGLGQLDTAAGLYERARKYRDAALLYERTGKLADAARCFAAGGQKREAAAALEKAGRLVDAADLWAELGEPGRAARLYLQSGRHARALLLAIDAADAVLVSEAFARTPAADLNKLPVAKRATLAGILFGGGRHLDAAALYVALGMLQDAGRAYARAGAHAKAGESYEKAGAFSEAAASFKDAGLPSKAAACYERAGTLEVAAGLYEQAQAYGDAARLWDKLEQPQRAASLYARAGLFDQAFLNAVAIGDMAMAAELYDRASKKTIRGLPKESLQKLASSLAGAGQLASAAAVFADIGDHLGAGRAYAKAGEPREAAEAFEKAGELVDAADQWNRCGEKIRAAGLLERAGRDADAAKLYEEVGDHASAARAYRQAGDYAAAGSAFQSAGAHEDAAKMFLLARDSRSAAESFVSAGLYVEAADAFDAAEDFALAGKYYEEGLQYLKAAECYARAGAKDKVLALCPKIEDWVKAYHLAFGVGGKDLALQIIAQHEIDAPPQDVANAYITVDESARAFPFCLGCGAYEIAKRISAELWSQCGEDAGNEVIERLVSQMNKASPGDVTELIRKIRPPFLHIADGDVAAGGVEDIDKHFRDLDSRRSLLKDMVLVEEIKADTSEIPPGDKRDEIDATTLLDQLKQEMNARSLAGFSARIQFLAVQLEGRGRAEKWVVVRPPTGHQSHCLCVGAQPSRSGALQLLRKCVFYVPVDRDVTYDAAVNDQMRREIRRARGGRDTLQSHLTGQIAEAMRAALEQLLTSY